MYSLFSLFSLFVLSLAASIATPFNISSSTSSFISILGNSTEAANSTGNDKTHATSNTTSSVRKPLLQWTERRPNRQCYDYEKYQNDEEFHPIYATYETTLNECKRRCEESFDANKRPCVAIEWSDSGTRPGTRQTELRICGLAYGCSRLKQSDDGSVYVLQSYFDASVIAGNAALPFVIMIQALIVFFASCVLFAAIQRFREAYSRRNGGARVSAASGIYTTNRRHQLSTASAVEFRQVALVMRTTDLIKEKNNGGSSGGGSGASVGGGDVSVDGIDIESNESRLTMKLEDKCFICLEPCTTCATCICHIPVHNICMSRMTNKIQCSVCRTPYGSGIN
jgi:hypothetical protein